jgi:signal transduction histidine kinase
MSRLYLRIHLALVGSLIVFATFAAVLWHTRGGPAEHGHSLGGMLAMLLMLAVAIGIFAYPVVRYLVRRLERLQQGAEALAAGDLSARVEVEGNDEVARLAASFNRAATRIEQLVGAHKMLLAQASHELRTPLTRIRLALDLAKDIDPKRKQGIEADIAELDHLIEEILLASRLDTLAGLDRHERIDLLALVAEECARYGVEVEGESAEVHGDQRLLRRLVRNLVGNAEHHGRPPIHVHVRAGLRAGARIAELIVADAGPEIAESEREHLFEPFYRQGNTDGHGLGLSLVRQIARRHGGDVRYGPTDSFGTGFVVVLPLGPPSPTRPD